MGNATVANAKTANKATASGEPSCIASHSFVSFCAGFSLADSDTLFTPRDTIVRGRATHSVRYKAEPCNEVVGDTWSAGRSRHEGGRRLAKWGRRYA